MSVEAAQAFFERIAKDGAFAARVAQCQNVAGLMAFARAEGFDFTAADAAAGTDDLSDEELQAIVGGAGGPDNLRALLTALRAATAPLPS